MLPAKSDWRPYYGYKRQSQRQNQILVTNYMVYYGYKRQGQRQNQILVTKKDKYTQAACICVQRGQFLVEKGQICLVR